MPRSFYRIVRTAAPVERDFTSNAALGRTLRDPRPESQRLWTGISVFATEAQARDRANDYPLLGEYIAQLVIPDDAPVRVERTIPRSRGHHTLWGHPGLLTSLVVDVVPVRPADVELD